MMSLTLIVFILFAFLGSFWLMRHTRHANAGTVGRQVLGAIGVLLVMVFVVVNVQAQTVVGRVSTTFRLVGPNDRIEVTRYDDPRVANVSCYVSRAVTGGLSGAVGLAEDPSRFSIACRAVGPVSIPQGLPDNEQVFDERASLFFKEIRVHRMVDRQKNVLVYLVTSTRLVNGSPFNSVTAVPVLPVAN